MLGNMDAHEPANEILSTFNVLSSTVKPAHLHHHLKRDSTAFLLEHCQARYIHQLSHECRHGRRPEAAGAQRQHQAAMMEMPWSLTHPRTHQNLMSRQRNLLMIHCKIRGPMNKKRRYSKG